jgi:hypothetical protein
MIRLARKCTDDPKYSVNEINISGKQVGAVILFRLRYVYTLIYFVGASYFIIYVFIYLLCCLSVVLQELPTLPEYKIHPFLVAQS